VVVVTASTTAHRGEDLYSRRWWALPVLSGSLLLVVMSNTSLNVALRDIQRALNPTSTELQWVLDMYPLVLAVLLLLCGAAGDRYGRRGALLTGLALFALVSMLGAYADTVGQLIAARAALGVAGALVMPATLALVRVMFPPAERARALAVWASSSGVALAAGPLLSGLVLEHFWWGSALLVNVPLAVVLLLAAAVLVPPSRNPSAPRLDVVGAALGGASMGGLVYAVIEGPARGWTSTPVLTGAAIAVFGLLLFLVVEQRITDPMVELRWFADRRFGLGAATALLLFVTLVGALYVVSLYLQLYQGRDALDTGLRLLPMSAALLAGAGLCQLLVRVGGHRAAITLGLLLAAGGTALLSTLDATSTDTLLFAATVLVGLGAGTATPAATEAVMDNAPAERSGVSAATADVAVEVGAALGVAVIGSVLASRYSAALPAAVLDPLPPPVRSAVEDSLGAALGVAAQAGPDGGLLATAARAAFLDGFTTAALVACAVAVAAALIALAMPGRRPRTDRPAGGPAEHAEHVAGRQR
jgi:EmrB/QacA subfamily drug resistance transporter